MDTVMIRSGKVVPLLGVGVTATGAGAAKYKDSPYSYFQAIVTGTGAVSATVAIQGSNDGVNFSTTALGTISLSGTTSAVDGLTYTGPCKYVRANVTAISGTGATVTATLGV